MLMIPLHQLETGLMQAFFSLHAHTHRCLPPTPAAKRAAWDAGCGM